METTVKTMYGDVLIHESIALLQEGHRVILAVKGSSMHPFIIRNPEGIVPERTDLCDFDFFTHRMHPRHT